ncbi:MAG: alpha-(1-_3)-arabinofuranosyltransferase domain-containing protein [Acidimicrobiales bacterium]
MDNGTGLGHCQGLVSRISKRVTSGRNLEIFLTVFLMVLAFSQDTGRIVIDTKLALAVNPAHLLHDAIHLWQFRDTFGSIQNQSYGYLFPMGPFFLAGHLLGLPAWIVQRSWLALFLVAGLWGTILLAEEMHIGNTASRAIASITYTCSPFVLTILMASGGILSTILLPWALLPLVRARRKGTSLARSAALSGVAVLCMGGINATTVLAVLFVPFIWILTRKDSATRFKLAGWWLLAMAMATVWFVGALMLQGIYGFDFLPYTETAHDTNFLTSVGEVIRGGGQWISLQVIHGIWTPPGWYFENDPLAIIATCIIAALGIYGLSRYDMPERFFLVCTIAFGVLVTSIGYWGHLGSPLSAPINALLDGVLAPLRNISKFQPLIDIALSLGLAHGLAVIAKMAPAASRPAKRATGNGRPRVANRADGRGGNGHGRTASPARSATRKYAASRWNVVSSLKAVGASLLAASLVFLMWPLLSSNLYPKGSVKAIPSYWYQASSWLASHSGRGTSLLVPGIDFGRFTWGVTNDQPMESISKSPWAIRSIAPLSSVGNIQMMDAVNNVLANGIPAPGLAPYLARNGIRYLVAENDQNPYTTAGPTPYEVAMMLAQTPGIKLVKRLGPPALAPNGGPDSSIIYDPHNLATQFDAIDIYRVEPPSPVITTYSASHGIELTGGPQALLGLANLYGTLPNVAASLAGDPLGPKFPSTTWVAADTQQQRDEDYGQIYNGYSYVLTSTEKAPGPSVSNETGKHPKPPKERTVVDGISHETVAVLHGARSITASSYGSPVARIPGYQPLAAFLDHPGDAAWASSGVNLHDPWIKITFTHPIYVNHITVTPLDDGPWRPLVTQVKIATQAGSRTDAVGPNQAPRRIGTAAGKTSWLKLTVTRDKPPIEVGSVSGPGIAHIAIPGLHISESWKVPSDGSRADKTPGTPTPTYLFSDQLVKPFAYLSPPAQEPQLDRLFSVPKRSTFTVAAQVSPNPGAHLLNLVNLADGYGGANYNGIKVKASSVYGGLPLFRQQNLVDGNPLTSWWAGAGDTHPTVSYSWNQIRTLNSLNIQLDLAASTPEEILIRSGNHSRLVHVPRNGGTVRFTPLRTNHVTFTFPKVKSILSFDSLTSHLIPLPIGIANLSFPALDKLPLPAINLQRQFSLKCGQGPPLQIGDTAYPTSVTGTVADLYALEPLNLVICGERTQQVTLGPGTQQVRAPYTGNGLRITAVDLLGTPLTAPVSARGNYDATSLLGSLERTSAPRQLAKGTSSSASSAGSSASNTSMSTPVYRKVTIDSWQATQRTVTIAQGGTAILDLRQNYNKGWTASVGGKTLRAVRLDGWQQGWTLPASTSPLEVHLSFPAENYYAIALLAGLLIALFLVAWAFWPTKRRPRRLFPSFPSFPFVFSGRFARQAGRTTYSRGSHTQRTRTGRDRTSGLSSQALSSLRPSSNMHAAQTQISTTSLPANTSEPSKLDPLNPAALPKAMLIGIVLALAFIISGPLVILAVPILAIALYARHTQHRSAPSWTAALRLKRFLRYTSITMGIVAGTAMLADGLVIAIKPGIHYTLILGTRGAGAQAFGMLALAALITAMLADSWNQPLFHHKKDATPSWQDGRGSTPDGTEPGHPKISQDHDNLTAQPAWFAYSAINASTTKPPSLDAPLSPGTDEKGQDGNE